MLSDGLKNNYISFLSWLNMVEITNVVWIPNLSGQIYFNPNFDGLNQIVDGSKFLNSGKLRFWGTTVCQTLS